MNSDGKAGHKGTTASRSSKRSKAQRRDRVRTWAQPSPLRHEWQALCVGKRRTDRQINRPEQPNARAYLPPHQRHARSFPAERSIAAPRRTSKRAAQARSRAQRVVGHLTQGRSLGVTCEGALRAASACTRGQDRAGSAPPIDTRCRAGQISPQARRCAIQRQFKGRSAARPKNSSGSSSSAPSASVRACWSVSKCSSHTCDVFSASTTSRIQRP